MTWQEYADLSAEQCDSMAVTIAEDGSVTCATVGVTESTVTITEDMPGWDCSTMGNLVCGPLPDTAMPSTDIAGIGALLVLAAIGAAVRRMVQR